jgi:hypothetical protein
MNTTDNTNKSKLVYAPFMDADAIKARETAEAARLKLSEVRAAWEAAGSPRGGKEEAFVAAAFAAWEDSCRWASAEARRAMAAYFA